MKTHPLKLAFEYTSSFIIPVTRRLVADVYFYCVQCVVLHTDRVSEEKASTNKDQHFKAN